MDAAVAGVLDRLRTQAADAASANASFILFLFFILTFASLMHVARFGFLRPSPKHQEDDADGSLRPRMLDARESLYAL